jgi:hypothetical protein
MRLRAFAEFIERPAGEVAVGFALIAGGAALYLLKIPKTEDAIIAGLTLIGRAMVAGGAKEN